MKKTILALIMAFAFIPAAFAFFLDVNENHKNYKAIKYMKDQDIITGYSDGRFRPDDSVNRVELLKMIIESQPNDFTLSSSDASCFTDVNEGEWYAPYACYAKKNGWVKGYKDNSFKPNAKLNKAEAVKIILLSYGLRSDSYKYSSFVDVDENEWYFGYIEKAVEQGIVDDDGDYFNPAKSVTRAEVSQFIYNAVFSNDYLEIMSGEIKRKGVSTEVSR
ncbi:MAG: S-layer homology domain-containing protein [Candidatus Gracilibacteria bacterium]|jgi:hypothetical protein|nr:S-layer homology domain-containing protein [Candidatus Gracilibacteria bacterium]